MTPAISEEYEGNWYEGIVEHETDKAFLFKDAHWKTAAWLPKSKIEYHKVNEENKNSKNYTIFIPRWLEVKLGLD